MNLFFFLFGSCFCQLSLSSYNFQVCWTSVTICSDNAGDKSGCYVETLFNGEPQSQSNQFVPDFSSSLFSDTRTCSNCCNNYGPSSTALSVTFKVWDENPWALDTLLQSYSASVGAGNWYTEGTDYTVCTERIDFTITDLGPTPSPTPPPTSVVARSPTYGPPSDDLSLCYFILDNTDGVNRSIIGNLVCDTGSFYSFTYNNYGGYTTINDAICQYDGGDCCGYASDTFCKDPRYVASPTPQPTTHRSDNMLGIVIVVAMVIVVGIGGVLGFVFWKRKKSTNADYQQMQDVETTNASP